MFSFFRKPKQTTEEKVKPGIGPQEALALINSLNDVRSRIASAISGGYDWADTLHNIYLDFGYPQRLDFYNYWNMYRRFGIAKNVCDLPVDTTWMRTPTIESSDQFIREFERLADALSFWIRLHAIDKRQRVGRYAGMFMRVRDGQTPDKPIGTRLNGIGSIMQMVPLYEGQLQVLETDNDPLSETYGLPTMYQFNGGNVGNRNDKAANSFSIHPDRIVIVSEDADNGGIYGVSSLEAPYNSLMDIRKILGGGGEGFYKNSAQSIVFNIQEWASLTGANDDLIDKFHEKYDEFAHNRHRRAIVAPGMDAKTLMSDLKDPKEFFFNALYDVAASSQIPATVLVGQQTGRLASSEDSRSFLSSINSRRENFGTEAINALIDWFIERGVLPSAEYSIEWDDLLALSQNEQLDNAVKMASINDSQFKSGGDIPFNGSEIRETAGFEPMEEIEPESELDYAE